jgi:hypothetical protein
MGINFLVISIPSTLTEAHNLQTRTAIKRAEQPTTLGPPPTVQAAAAVADLLRKEYPPVTAAADDGDDLEGEVEEEEDGNIDTHVSSDSGDEGEDKGKDEDDLKEQEHVSVNVGALGGQALACTVHKLAEIGARMEDLAVFLKRKSGLLSAMEQECLS